MQHVIGRNAIRASCRPRRNVLATGSLTRRICRYVSYEAAKLPQLKEQLDLPRLDRKWQESWEVQRERAKGEERTGGTTDSAKKMYILPMFPYPSGDLHLGHLRVYTISDVLARFWRMQGYNVIHPIGWDAFGLPAENAAIERGIDPAIWTEQNIKNMKQQLKAMNGDWDWDREIATCDPKFYKHTQRIFLMLHEAGLAYQAESMVNWDPVDKTVLANEQVDADGCSWRSGAEVEQRRLKQWFFRISEYRDALLNDLDHLSKDNRWPERVLAMQKNWLGKSKGALIRFPVIPYNQASDTQIQVFTTRPDTLFGVQYLALASTHPLVKEIAPSDPKLQAFLDTISALPPDSKAGYLLPNVRAANPLSYDDTSPDATKASLPIYIAPYVLADYGDGAVMGVPGHDPRDYAFWKHNRSNDPVRMVVAGSLDEKKASSEPFIHHGYLTSHSGIYAGQTTAEATDSIVNWLESKNLGSASETWRLRDWLISRQRYWGTPIPIIHCGTCGPVPVPADELPVKLPPVQGHWLKGKSGNPLEDAHDWVNTSCPKCGQAAKRDTDTMDTFVDSSWYFMRFADTQNGDMPFSAEAAMEDLPVDFYVGGVEHAILHLLYARFMYKFLSGSPPAGTDSYSEGEPFQRLITQGMVLGKTFSDPSNGRFLKPDEVDLRSPSKPIINATRVQPNISYEKMSKSKYNGVDPTACMMKHGADATRAHMLFQAPVSDVLEWDEEKIAGVTRWMNRIWDFICQSSQRWHDRNEEEASLAGDQSDENFNAKAWFLEAAEDAERNSLDPYGGRDTLACIEAHKELWRKVQQTIISVEVAYAETMSLNTVVSDLMALTNVITNNARMSWGRLRFNGRIELEATKQLVLMMAPIAPALAEECWILLNPPKTWVERFASPSIELRRRNIERVEQAKLAHKQLLQEIALNLPLLDSMVKRFFKWHDGLGEMLTKMDPVVFTSIFAQPFPTTDDTLELLSPANQRCAVMINGKLKFVVEIPIAPMDLKGKGLESWMKKQILTSEAGKQKLKGKDDVERAKRIVVVRNGQMVNFVM